jgi:hypothetical protein
LRARLPSKIWRRGHLAATGLAVSGTVLHALLIEGAMEVITKALLCALVLAAFAYRAFVLLRRRAR